MPIDHLIFRKTPRWLLIPIMYVLSLIHGTFWFIALNKRIERNYRKATPRWKWRIAYRYVIHKWSTARAKKSWTVITWEILEEYLVDEYEKKYMLKLKSESHLSALTHPARVDTI